MTGRAWGSVTMAGIAAVAAVISYSDGLFLVRLAGNRDWHAYLYPLLPDGLIVICLIALLAAVKRPAWPTFGLGLGIALTLAMNVAAGIAHSELDAVVDGFVPVVFFVAVEVFIGYVRRGRSSAHAGTVSPPSFTDAQTAALAMLERTAAAGNPLSQNKLMTQFRLSRAEVRDVYQRAGLDERSRNGVATPAVAVVPAGGVPPAPAGALNGHGTARG